jgi:hypothetical protein
VAGGIAAGSIALMAGGMALAYVDRHALPADLTNWTFADVFQDVVNMGCPSWGSSLPPGGQRTAWAGCSWRRASRSG